MLTDFRDDMRAQAEVSRLTSDRATREVVEGIWDGKTYPADMAPAPSAS